ncbi:MAG TPA: hypothetical protein VFZ23_15135 [Pyrinomonadaceae bacterium]
MKRGTKIFLGVGCGVLLLGGIAVLVGGYLAMNYFQKTVGEGLTKEMNEGHEFGKSTDQAGCMTEAVRRSQSFGPVELGGAMGVSAFVGSCFETSRPTADFCAGVPSFWSPEASEWSSAECRKAGADPEKTACVHVFKRKHQLCSPPF